MLGRVSNGIVLGQRKVDGKSNEISAIPELLHLLNVSGCIVTIDAMGCQNKIAQKIRDEKADYMLRVKDNQSNLKQDVVEWFAYGDSKHFEGMQMDFHQTTHKTSGRIEIRRCWAVSDPWPLNTSATTKAGQISTALSVSSVSDATVSTSPAKSPTTSAVCPLTLPLFACHPAPLGD